MRRWTPQHLLDNNLLTLEHQDNVYMIYGLSTCMVFCNWDGGISQLSRIFWDKESREWLLQYADGDYAIDGFDETTELLVFKLMAEPPVNPE